MASRSSISRVKLIRITGGRMSLVNRKSPGQSQAFEKVDITVRDFSPTASIPFQTSADSRGAHVSLEGKVGPLAEKDAAMTPVDAALKVTNLDCRSRDSLTSRPALTGWWRWKAR